MKVTAARKLEAWNKFLRDGGSANDVAAFEDGDGKAAAGEVRSGGEAVMAAADDESVPFLILQRGSSSAKTPSPHFFLVGLSLGLGEAVSELSCVM